MLTCNASDQARDQARDLPQTQKFKATPLKLKG